jgi:O-succinylbenzoic acid--CoA ligase
LKSKDIIHFQNNLELKKQVDDFLTSWYDTKDYIETYSSGSTGKPKCIRIKKNKMKESARMTGEFFNLKKGDTALLCLSPLTIAGKMMIVRAVVLELKLLVTEVNSNPIKYLEIHIDFIAMVPIQLLTTLELCPEKLHKCKNIIIGGAEISETLSVKIKDAGLTIYHTFGMTETISHIAMRKVGVITEDYFTALGETYFTNKNEYLVIHSTLLDNGKLKTNDSVELIDSKRFKWKGRADFIINSGGVKIQPELVEKKINHLLSVPFFIIGITDEKLGQKVVLFVESSNELLVNKNELKSLLLTYENPREIYFLKEFIRTESGKINRIKTKELISN